jgi:hemolysin III
MRNQFAVFRNSPVTCKSMETPIAIYSKEEEYANTISHAIGFLAAFVGTGYFVFKAWGELSLIGNIGVWIYSAALLCAMATSSLYHGTIDRRLKVVYKKLDHISIYLLISGSYTILILNRLVNTDGYLFLAALWGMSVVGIWFKARYVHRYKVFSTVIYIIMGYIIFANPTVFYDVLKPETIRTLSICGGIYTVGAGFYLWKSQKWTHFTWHILVLIAASLHFVAVYSELISV